jgi:rRNA-processing protein EBP2
MAKKKSKAATKQNSAASKAKEEQERVTMKALEEMSDSDDDEEIPESQWTTKAKNLRQEIDGGKFDKLLGVLKQAKGDEEEFEEASLGSSDDDEEEGDEEAEVEGDAVEDEASEEEEEDDDEDEEAESEEKEPINVEAAEAEGSDEDEEDSEDEEDTKLQRVTKNNFINSKALSIVTAELAASHAHLPWAETFCVIPATPLPFGQKGGDEDSNPLDIHDDLKREVAFYNSAIEAVHDARVKCKEANIPFSRPEDFFAEMIKTDGKWQETSKGSAAT